ncbi:MAG: hypothetical protein V3V89_03325 [Gammaproteobacteria bacterium]
MISACGHSQNRQGEGPGEKKFNIKSLAKSDIDTILDIHVQEARNHLQELMIKLYKRNPRELKKSKYKTARENIVRVFDLEHEWNFPELEGKKGADAIQLAFDNSFEGDRVFSFIVGLTSMLMASYEYKTEFYLFDTVDPQKLYNSARNIEIAVWKIEHDMDMNGELFLYSNSLPGEVTNLSYERLFGKLIATQDMIAIIIADKTNRVIKKVFQSMATAVFFPI